MRMNVVKLHVHVYEKKYTILLQFLQEPYAKNIFLLFKTSI